MEWMKYTLAMVEPSAVTNLTLRRRYKEMARHQLVVAGCTEFKFCKAEYVTEETEEGYRGDPVYKVTSLGR